MADPVTVFLESIGSFKAAQTQDDIAAAAVGLADAFNAAWSAGDAPAKKDILTRLYETTLEAAQDLLTPCPAPLVCAKTRAFAALSDIFLAAAQKGPLGSLNNSQEMAMKLETASNDLAIATSTFVRHSGYNDYGKQLLVSNILLREKAEALRALHMKRLKKSA